MLKIFILLGSVVLPILLLAQKSDSLSTEIDSIKLDEVRVFANLPLNDQNIVDLYRTNHFATIDNINSRLNGMTLIKRGAYAQEPQLNGFSGGQLNVTIDGMKMFGACTDKMDPITSYIEPTNLKNIVINQGTNCSENGCNIGGTVNMSLRDPAMNGQSNRQHSVGVGYETVSNSKNVLFTTTGSKNQFSWIIDGVYRNNENYTDGTGAIIPFTQFRKINLHGAVKYNFSENEHLKADVLYDDARDVGYPALPMDVAIAKATLVALEYRKKATSDIKAKVYFNSIYHLMDDSKRDSLYILDKKVAGKSDTVFMRMDMPGESSTLGAYYLQTIQYNSKNKLQLKIDNYTNLSIAEMTMFMRFQNESPESPMYMQTWPEMLRNVSGLYVQNTTYLTDKLTVSANARMDYNVDILQSEYGPQQFTIFNYSLEKSDSRFAKSINVNAEYRVNENLSLGATTGFSERIPTIGERFGFYLYNAYDGYDYIGNPYLKNEQSKFYQLAFEWKQKQLKLNVNQSISFLTNYILGLTDETITPMNFFASGIRVYSNIPNALLYSSDIQFMYTPTKHFTTFVNSKYTYGQLNEAEAMPLVPPLHNIVAVQYKNKQFMLQAELENAFSQKQINIDYGEKITDGFNVINVKSSYEFNVFGHELTTSLGITNVFNKAYYAHLDWGRIYRPGRSFECYIQYLF